MNKAILLVIGLWAAVPFFALLESIPNSDYWFRLGLCSLEMLFFSAGVAAGILSRRKWKGD